MSVFDQDLVLASAALSFANSFLALEIISTLRIQWYEISTNLRQAVVKPASDCTVAFPRFTLKQSNATWG